MGVPIFRLFFRPKIDFSFLCHTLSAIHIFDGILPTILYCHLNDEAKRLKD